MMESKKKSAEEALEQGRKREWSGLPRVYSVRVRETDLATLVAPCFVLDRDTGLEYRMGEDGVLTRAEVEAGEWVRFNRCKEAVEESGLEDREKFEFWSEYLREFEKRVSAVRREIERERKGVMEKSGIVGRDGERRPRVLEGEK